MLTLFLGLIPINFIKIFFLNIIGHSISYKSKIGVTFLHTNKIILKDYSKIGHFNFINAKSIKLDESSFIGKFNIINGPIDIVLNEKSGISKNNKIRRSKHPITYGDAFLKLGKNSFIVSNHFLDLTKSVEIGGNSILAGINSQIWTHGYYHSDSDTERIRIDGEVNIGDNVYVGSGCIFNPGVYVSNAIHIGSGSVISKDLKEPGMYVSQSLRFIDNNLDKVKLKTKKVEGYDLAENVYTKN